MKTRVNALVFLLYKQYILTTLSAFTFENKCVSKSFFAYFIP